MNILLVTPLYSQHYDAGHFWLRALNQLGHTVTVWDYRLDPKPPPMCETPDLTLVMKGEIINPRDLPPYCFCYWPDALERTPGIENILQQYDRVFTPVRPTPEWMEWLPTGWDETIHQYLNLERSIGSLYIGTANSEYKMEMIKEIDPDVVCGNGWSRDFEVFYGPQYLREFVYWANCAKVLINVHQSPEVGINRKLFELIACGFTTTDNVLGVAELLGPVLESAVTYPPGNSTQAKEMVQYYLTHRDEREGVWKLEREAILPYTYLMAAERILSCLG